MQIDAKKTKPAVFWFTGLPGAGKSTLAEALFTRLKQKQVPTEWLDGDQVRALLPRTGFGREARIEHIERIGHTASLLEKHGVVVLCSFVSPHKEARDFARSLAKNFTEIYLSTPLAVCEKRDPKGMYAKARKGEIRGFTGIDDPYEVPQNPELTIDTSLLSLEESIEKILQYWATKK